MLSTQELLKLSKSAIEAAKAAGDYIQSQFNRHYEIKEKASGTSLASKVVTAVDFKAQEIILDRLKPTFQQYDLGLLTEESVDDQSRLEKPYFWCIDPLDGTLPFTQGETGYAVSIALITQAGNPIIGIVYIPDEDKCYSAIQGLGVKLNDQAFERVQKADDNLLHVYMDSSLKKETYFKTLQTGLDVWSTNQRMVPNYHFGYGGVRNALAVINSINGCYFKLPKPQDGGGSIWDFAATRLFFDELNLHVSSHSGEILHLNNAATTFMNDAGVIYATDKKLVSFIMTLDFNP